MSNANSSTDSSQHGSKLMSFLNFLAPSVLDLWIYFVIFGITVIVSQPSQYKDTLQSLNINDFQGSFVYRVFNDVTHFIDTQMANEASVYIFWVIVAVVIYVIASRLTRNVEEFAHDVSLKQYIWPSGSDKGGPLREFTEKLVFRVVVFIMMIVYLVKFTPLLVSAWKGTDFKFGFTLHTLLLYCVLFLYVAVFCHIFVVLLRLFLIRRRVIDV